MNATATTRDALIAWLKTIGPAVPGSNPPQTVPLWRDVVSYAKSKLADETFFNELQKLSLPACIVCYSGDNRDGRPAQRDIDWTLYLIDDGVQKDAEGTILAKLDIIREKLGKTISNGKVLLFPKSESEILGSEPQHVVMSVEIHTREFA